MSEEKKPLHPRTQLLIHLDELREAFVHAQEIIRKHGGLGVDDNKNKSAMWLCDKWLQRYCNEVRNRAYEHWPNTGLFPPVDDKLPHHD